MAKLTIDGREFDVADGKTVLQVCLDEGIDVPYFCYHKKLSIAGNCRMCLVEMEGSPKPVIACNTPVRDKMVIRTKTPQVLKDRRAVLEFILINHPLDCPICDQAGECDLQDLYFKHSAVPYRFRETKQHKPKAVPLGDLVVLDDERCILCTRCVRFCDEVVGESELAVSERGDRATITTFQGRGMKNAYSLNTVDLCPVGALTNRDFRFHKRVWFLQSAKSLCTGCATGCNTLLDHQGGIVYRYRPRENDAVNSSWMCDEGRLSYKYLNAPDRIDAPYARSADAGWERLTTADAMAALRGMCDAVAPTARGVVLSAQCSNEENFSWWWLAHEEWRTAHLFGTWRDYPAPSQDQLLRHADKNPNRRFLELVNATIGGAHVAPPNGQSPLGPPPLARGARWGTSSSTQLRGGPELLFVLDTLDDRTIAMLMQQRPRYVVVLATNWGTHLLSTPRWRPMSASGPIVAKDGGAETLEALQMPAPREAFGWADLVLPLATFAEQSGTMTNAQGRVQRFVAALRPKGEAESGWGWAKRVAQLGATVWPWGTVEETSAAMGELLPALQGVSYLSVGDHGGMLRTTRSDA